MAAAARLRLLVATTNAGKLAEIRDVLAGAPADLIELRTLDPLPEPEETGASFADNARLKALYYSRRTDLAAVAEDSGLVIDALGGEPGVRSARFLSPSASYHDRFREIERRLSERPEAPRTARFVCALAVAAGERIVFEATGSIEGFIVAPAGAAGFGYDPIFYYPPYHATLAQVDRAAKLDVAHRGQAFRALRRWLMEHADQWQVA